VTKLSECWIKRVQNNKDHLKLFGALQSFFLKKSRWHLLVGVAIPFDPWLFFIGQYLFFSLV